MDKSENYYTKLKADTETIIPFIFNVHSRTNRDRKQLSDCQYKGWVGDALELHNGGSYTTLQIL